MAIDIAEANLAELPGIQEALGLTAAVVIRKGSTVESPRFFNAAANTGAARMAALALALAVLAAASLSAFA